MNNRRLRKLKLEHGLMAKDIKALLNTEYYVKIDGQEYGPLKLQVSINTVNSWIKTPGVKGFNPMPDLALAVLELKLSTNTHKRKAS